jgi:CBS domain-containing protein
VVFRVIAPGLDPKETRLRQVMTPDPKTLSPNQSYGHALVIMQENGFRHVPVVDEKLPIGIISSRNAMDPDLEEFVADQRRREHFR